MIRAEEFRHNLGTEFPTFIKQLFKSHISGGLVGLPQEFCKLHLPRKDLFLILEDDNGKDFEVIYIFQRPALSGGWTKFVVAHKLHEGDVLIFQLVKPLDPIRLKVYIVKAKELNGESGALNLLNIDERGQQKDTEIGVKRKRSKTSTNFPNAVKFSKKLLSDARNIDIKAFADKLASGKKRKDSVKTEKVYEQVYTCLVEYANARVAAIEAKEYSLALEKKNLHNFLKGKGKAQATQSRTLEISSSDESSNGANAATMREAMRRSKAEAAEQEEVSRQARRGAGCSKAAEGSKRTDAAPKVTDPKFQLVDESTENLGDESFLYETDDDGASNKDGSS